MDRKVKENKKPNYEAPESTDQEIILLLTQMNRTLQKMNSNLKSMVYYQKDSRGFEAGIEQAIAQPFVSEAKDIDFKKIVREVLKKKGDK